jgi:hypothetical protein
MAKRNGLAVTVRGMPAGIGVRIRLVAVYQYEPKVGLGLVNNSTRALSNNSFDQVMNFLDKLGDWSSMSAGGYDRVARAASIAAPVVAAVGYGAVRRIGYQR